MKSVTTLLNIAVHKQVEHLAGKNFILCTKKLERLKSKSSRLSFRSMSDSEISKHTNLILETETEQRMYHYAYQKAKELIEIVEKEEGKVK